MKINNINKENLVGAWTLNQDDVNNAGTSIKDKSGNGNDGVIAVTPATFEQDQNGVPNQAMTFDGVGDYLTVGNIGNIKSISGWIYPTADDKSLFDLDGGTTSVEISSGTLSSTAWTAPIYYVNGVVSQTLTLNAWNFITITDTTAENASALIIGNEASYYTGSISDLAIYSSALTQGEVSKLYLAGRTTAKIKMDANNANKITPKLQKGLILDMPLAEPYTEAGDDKIVSTLVNLETYAYTTFTEASTSGFTATSDGSTTHWAGTADEIVFVSGKKYYVAFDLNLVSGTAPNYALAVGLYNVPISKIIDSVDGFNSYTFTASQSTTGVLAWNNLHTVSSFIVSNLIIKELDAITKDRTPQGNDGTVSGATITENSYDFDGTNDLITIGNVGTTAKTLSFWVSLDSTTESILEETDNVGVSVSSGTMSYGSWDNCFIDGVDTDTITTGWHQVILTSTTDVDVSALRLGLVNTAYFDGQISGLKIWNEVLDVSQINYLYSKEVNKY